MTTEQTMRAYRLRDWQDPGWDEVPMPEPGYGEVRIRVAGVGLCHTDVMFLDLPAGLLPYTVPWTLGHEIAGWVEAVGTGVDDVAVDDAVAVACMSTCGKCTYCRRGADNYCVNTGQGRGFGLDGGLSSHIVVARRDLVPIGDLDPLDAAPLTDAGATSYHAVRRVLPKLRPGSTAVVIGVGGLGGYAVQWLRLLSRARIIAVESREERLATARDLGAADVVLAGEGMSKRLREAVGDSGADAVLDFVGTDDTMKAAIRNAATLGSVAIVGQGFGSVSISYGAVAHDCDVFIPQGSTIAELEDVLRMARAGDVVIETETFAFDDTPSAYERLKTGTLNGRAVVLPGS
jgi:propanol-preferring alcohol dehydrogenase